MHPKTIQPLPQSALRSRLATSLRRYRGALAALTLVAAVFAGYASALNGPMFFDDEHFIQKNVQVHSLEHISTIYSSGVTAGAAIRGNFYRPNQQLAFALLYHWFGETSWPYHLLSIGLHALNAVLVWRWLLLLACTPLGAWLGALVFALHPVQTEAVAYISGLADPLGLPFMLMALLVFMRLSRPLPAPPATGGGALPAWDAALLPLVILLLMVGALFTKENGVVTAPLLLLTGSYQCLRQARRPRASEWAVFGLATAAALAWSVLKLTLLNFGTGFGLSDQHNVYTDNLSLRLSTFVSVLWDYAGMLLWPAQLFYEKPYTAYDSLLTSRGAFGMAVLVGTLLAVWRARSRPLMALGACVGLAALLPFTGVIPLNAMFLEHWLYVPMVGVAVLVAAAVGRLQRGWQLAPKKAPPVRKTSQAFARQGPAPVQRQPGLAWAAGFAVSILLIAALWRTSARAAQWADVEAFYLNEIDHSANSGRIYNNLGMYYADHHDTGRAIHYYELAVAGPTGKLYAQPHHNLANVYLAERKIPEAISELRTALQIDPQFVYSLNMLAQIFKAVGDDARADLANAALAQLQSGHDYDHAALNSALFGH